MSLLKKPALSTVQAAQAAWEAEWPRVRKGIRTKLRCLRGHPEYPDWFANAVGLAWQDALSLTARGKDWRPFAGLLGQHAAMHTRRGDRFGRCTLSRDYYREGGWRPRKGSSCRVRPANRGTAINPADSLPAPLGNGVAHFAAFRLDLRAWLETLRPVRRRFIELLADGNDVKTACAALGWHRGYGFTLRRRLWRSYQSYTSCPA